MILKTTASPLRLCFCQLLVVFGQNKIANFLAKAGASFPCAVPSLVVLYSFFPAVATTRLDVAHLEMQYFTLTSESSSFSSPFGAISMFFRIQAVNFPTFAAMIRASFDLVTLIIHNKNSSSSACGHSSLCRILSLSKASCFLTSTVSYFLTFLLYGMWPDKWISTQFFARHPSERIR